MRVKFTSPVPVCFSYLTIARRASTACLHRNIRHLRHHRHSCSKCCYSTWMELSSTEPG